MTLTLLNSDYSVHRRVFIFDRPEIPRILRDGDKYYVRIDPIELFTRGILLDTVGEWFYREHTLNDVTHSASLEPR